MYFIIGLAKTQNNTLPPITKLEPATRGTHIYPTYAEAEANARVYARNNTARVYYVLQGIAAFQVSDIPVEMTPLLTTTQEDNTNA